VIYALQNSSSLRAFSASTGALLWTNLAQSIIGLSSSAIYVLTSTNQVQGINITNGALLWSYNAAQNGTASFGPGDGVIYYNTTHGLRALSAGTGTLLWSHFTPATVYSYFQSDSNGIAYVVTDDTAKNAITLHAYNATKGSLLWKYAL
jgi:outer membrane protein assembly factor BamB